MMRKRVTAAEKIRRPVAKLALVAAAVALLCLMVAGPVVAQSAAPKVKARPFMAQTIVTSVDATAKTITATVVKGNRAMKASLGTDVVFTLSDAAVLVKVSKDGATTIGLGDLVAGDRVMIHGRIDLTNLAAPVFKAWLIIDRGPKPTTT
jgi:hypothetical protein